MRRRNDTANQLTTMFSCQGIAICMPRSVTESMIDRGYNIVMRLFHTVFTPTSTSLHKQQIDNDYGVPNNKQKNVGLSFYEATAI